MMNNRRESRFPLPGLQVGIRRAGWKPSSEYQPCRLVDLSLNGLAFVAHDDALNPLDKIGFRIPVGGCEAKGRAVVCYRRAEGGGLWRYGCMFLEVEPDIGTLMREAEVDPAEVRAVARALAEEMVLAGCESDEARSCLRRQMLLQEAISAWLGRLAELRHEPPVSVLVDPHGTLRIEGPEPLTIVAVPGRTGYATPKGEYFPTVFDVLEYLQSTLGRLAQPKRPVM